MSQATDDPFKTLFVSRVNYYTSESKLRREFDTYGPVKSIRVVHDSKNGKPRGYAFIEYEHERDMHCKYTEDGVGFAKFFWRSDGQNFSCIQKDSNWFFLYP